MTAFHFVCVFIVAACFNVVFTAENTGVDYEGENNTEKPVGKSYSLSTCDYSSQVGYTCLSCHRALRCYPGNAAILVDCYGLFRYCRDGRCSMYQGDKCFDNKLTTPSQTSDTKLPTSDVTANIDTTARVDTSANVDTTARVDTTANVDTTARVDTTANIDTTANVDTTARFDTTAHVDTTVFADATTRVVAETVTESVSLPIDLKETTKSDDVSSTNAVSS